MIKNYKTKEQITNELEEMRRQQEQLEACRRELLSVQKKYDKIIEFAPDAIAFVDVESRIVFVNAHLEKLFGYDEDELTGKHLDILIPERFRTAHPTRQNGSNC